MMYTNIFLEYKGVLGCEGPVDWIRHPRHPLPLQKDYAKNLLRDMKRLHRSQEFRLVEEPITGAPDDDIPF